MKHLRFIICFIRDKQMTSAVSELLWSRLMKDGSDFNDQSSLIFDLWSKYRKSHNELNQVNELCQSYMEIKQNINSNTTVQDLEEICRQHQSQKWVTDFIRTLADCTRDEKTNELDPDKAHASLTAGFNKNFFSSVGIQMLFYSLHSLFQSYRAWNLINSLHMPSYDNQIRRTQEKLDQCVVVCSPLIDLPTLNDEQIRKLRRVQELLRDIKDSIQFILDDLKNKIAQAKKSRSNNYISAVMNLFSTILNAMLWDRVGRVTGEYSQASLTAGASTLIQASCTLGDLIHGGKANEFIWSLDDIVDIMTDLEEKQRRLSIQVAGRLFNTDDPL